MAKASLELVRALRLTAVRLSAGVDFKWSHHGTCICGNLAQILTGHGAREIHDAAYGRPGDWGEQARDYCPSSGLPMDTILARMFAAGMTASDVRHLERLDDPSVLRRLPEERRGLRWVVREDAVLYMRAWAALLEEQLPEDQRAELHAPESAAA